jgi:hypothetical protein
MLAGLGGSDLRGERRVSSWIPPFVNSPISLAIMKKFTITNAKICTNIVNEDDLRRAKFEIEGDEDMQASDGFHTFDELYEHRITLFIALSREFRRQYSIERLVPWRSKLHADGSSFDDWFIMGIGREKGEQISYHLPLSTWDETDFAETLEKAPEWDGHIPADVLECLKAL